MQIYLSTILLLIRQFIGVWYVYEMGDRDRERGREKIYNHLLHTSQFDFFPSDLCMSISISSSTSSKVVCTLKFASSCSCGAERRKNSSFILLSFARLSKFIVKLCICDFHFKIWLFHFLFLSIAALCW